jgi:hypothetical protein
VMMALTAEQKGGCSACPCTSRRRRRRIEDDTSRRSRQGGGAGCRARPCMSRRCFRRVFFFLLHSKFLFPFDGAGFFRTEEDMSRLCFMRRCFRRFRFCSFCVGKFFLFPFSSDGAVFFRMEDAQRECAGGCERSDEAFDRINLGHWMELTLAWED